MRSETRRNRPLHTLGSAHSYTHSMRNALHCLQFSEFGIVSPVMRVSARFVVAFTNNIHLTVVQVSEYRVADVSQRTLFVPTTIASAWSSSHPAAFGRKRLVIVHRESEDSIRLGDFQAMEGRFVGQWFEFQAASRDVQSQGRWSLRLNRTKPVPPSMAGISRR